MANWVQKAVEGIDQELKDRTAYVRLISMGPQQWIYRKGVYQLFPVDLDFPMRCGVMFFDANDELLGMIETPHLATRGSTVAIDFREKLIETSE